MSIAPLSARRSRFFAVVASAPFILLMLDTGGHPAQPANISAYCPTKSLSSLRTAGRRLAQTPQTLTGAQCCVCTEPFYNKCISKQACADFILDSDAPEDEELMRQCYRQCDKDAQDECACACKNSDF
jgi:hypothetical protein